MTKGLLPVLRISAAIIACTVMITYFCGFALAETGETELARRVGFDALSDFAKNTGFDAWATLEKLLSGEGGTPTEVLKGLLGELKQQIQSAFSALLRGILPPVLLCVVLRLLTDRERAVTGMSNLLCSLCCALALGSQAVMAKETTEAFMESVNRASAVLTPVLVSTAALTGATVTASIMTPLAAECAELITLLLRDLGLKLCLVDCVVAISGSLSPRFTLRRLFALIKSAVHWLLAASMFVFGGLMSARGLIGATRDTAAIQAAKLALENLIPVIGGEVSGSAGSLAASAGVVCKAIGMTGMALIFHICVAPMLKLGAAMVSIKIIAAVLEPLAGDVPAAMLVGQFGEIMELLLALCVCAAVVTSMLVGGCTVLIGL